MVEPAEPEEAAAEPEAAAAEPEEAAPDETLPAELDTAAQAESMQGASEAGAPFCET